MLIESKFSMTWVCCALLAMFIILERHQTKYIYVKFELSLTRYFFIINQRRLIPHWLSSGEVGTGRQMKKEELYWEMKEMQELCSEQPRVVAVR